MPTFLVLQRRDETDVALVAEDQRDAALQHGFSSVTFRVEGPTRGYARKAWDAHRTGLDIDYSAEEDDAEWGLERLRPTELTSVFALVNALVSGDRTALESARAFEHGDPYRWTYDYGRFGQVHLAMPPGDPCHWGGGVESTGAGSHVIVDMWTLEEGPSDLCLQCEVSEGITIARFRDLLVM